MVPGRFRYVRNLFNKVLNNVNSVAKNSRKKRIITIFIPRIQQVRKRFPNAFELLKKPIPKFRI